MSLGVEIVTDTEAVQSGSGPERRCIVTGVVRPSDELIRFVAYTGSSGIAEIVPDIEGRLPGRGLWITARQDIVAAAVTKKAFAKAARMAVTVPSDLVEKIAALLTRRCLDLLGLARRAGQAVAGFEQVREWAERGRVAMLVEASDGSAAGQRKVLAKTGDVPVVVALTGQELGEVFGRDWVGHVALGPGRIAEKLRRDASRLAGFRPGHVSVSERRLTTDG